MGTTIRMCPKWTPKKGKNMAEWAHEITLIALKEPAERLNKNGFPNEHTEQQTTVFCNKKNVGYAEYFKSQQAGATVNFKVEVNKVDYEGQMLAEFESKRYSILKTYEINDDTIELTLSDLREQAASVKESEA